MTFPPAREADYLPRRDELADGPHGKAEFLKVSLGNSAEMRGNMPGQTERLLQADLSRLEHGERYAAGAWVLAVTSEIVEGWPQGVQAVNPLLARIKLGAGGTTQVFEVDATPGLVMQLPAAHVEVELFWEKLPVDDEGLGGAPFRRPGVVRTRGTLQRGHATDVVCRSFLLRRTSSRKLQTGLVPPWSGSVMVHADQGAAVYAAPARLRLKEGTQGLELADWSGPQVLAQRNQGRTLSVPCRAQIWEVEALVDRPTRIGFHLIV